MIQRFRRNKKLFQFYYLFMIPVIGGIWLLYINNAFRADLAYLIMLTAYLLLFSLAFLVISRYHIQTFLFLLMIIRVFTGFIIMPGRITRLPIRSIPHCGCLSLILITYLPKKETILPFIPWKWKSPAGLQHFT